MSRGFLEWNRPPFHITTDITRADLNFVHGILANTYWAQGRTREQVKKSLKHSIPFSMFIENEQIGFGRVVTDRAVFGYVADIIIAPEHRGKGLGKWLMSCIFSHPDLERTKLLLETKDAHSFYEHFGFERRECMKRQL
jgi:GNAT superfamily N-acetyltransferase